MEPESSKGDMEKDDSFLVFARTSEHLGHGHSSCTKKMDDDKDISFLQNLWSLVGSRILFL